MDPVGPAALVQVEGSAMPEQSSQSSERVDMPITLYKDMKLGENARPGLNRKRHGERG